MNRTKLNAKDEAAYRSHNLFSAALAMLGLLVCTAPGRACSLNVGPGSTLTICGGTVTTDCVNVAAGGAIVISTGGTLALNGNNGNDTSTIDGRIELTSSSSTLRISDNSHTLEGEGYIDGQHNSARIVVASGLTLINETTVCGSLQIWAASGTFDNDGLVEADDNGGTLDCKSGTFAGSGEYKVATAGATLKFASGIDDTGLAAAFTVGNATALLDIDEDVVSSRNAGLSFTAGTISVAPTKTFQIE